MRTLKTAIVAAALLGLAVAGPAQASSANPIFGKAKVELLSKKQNKEVVGKGTYADYFGYYGNVYSYYGNYFGNYAYYNTAANSSDEQVYYYYAHVYSQAAADNYYAAFYYSYYGY